VAPIRRFVIPVTGLDLSFLILLLPIQFIRSVSIPNPVDVPVLTGIANLSLDGRRDLRMTTALKQLWGKMWGGKLQS